MTRGGMAIVGVALAAMPAYAAEPGRGFPFRGAPNECIAVEPPARRAHGDHRWFVTALAQYRNRGDACTTTSVQRYGQAAAWQVRLTCPGGAVLEDWQLNTDGTITADRAGSKILYRACEHNGR